MTTRAAVALLVLLALCPLPAAAQGSDGPRLTLRGLVSTTVFAQDHSFGFGNGQSASWAAAQAPAEDPWFVGGDVRNTRLSLHVAQPADTARWRPAAVVEVDFFGGFNGTGAFSDEQPHPRLRLAYVEVSDGTTSVRLGQAPTPLCGLTPASTSHIAFPLGLGSAGVIGWRFPGIFATRRLHQAPGLQVQVQAAAFRGSWDGPGNNLEQQSAGETSGLPQLEARVDVAGGASAGLRWNVYAVGHYDRKDLSGTAAGTADDLITGSALQVGGRVVSGPVTLQGNAYTGHAIGQQFGQLVQFGPVSGWGGWGQVGYAATPTWSVWFFAGMDDPSDSDLTAVAGRVRTRNATNAAMIRRQAGPIGIGVEWVQARTDWREAVGAEVQRRTANQLAVSAIYQF